jgi:transcriptional regulator with XRE-family HTH domain
MDDVAGHRTFTSGPELREEREAAELTQVAIAEAMGVSRSTVVLGEGRAKVRPSFARRYREAIAALMPKVA